MWAMMNFDALNDLFDQVIDSQNQSLEGLGNYVMNADALRELVLKAREIERLAQLTTVTLLRELAGTREWYPHTAGGFNNMVHQGRFSRKELKDYVRLAEELFPDNLMMPDIDRFPAPMPATKAGFEAGHFGAASAMEVVRVLEQLPLDISDEVRAHIEAMMAEFARSLAPDDLRKAGLKILQGLAAEEEPKDELRQRQRDATLSRQRADLMASFHVTATPELHALLSRLFADYAGPGDLLPEGEKAGDDRLAGQRRHDALVAALKYALHRNGPMPPTRGCSTIVAAVTVEQLANAAGVIPTDVGTLLSIPDLLRLGGEGNDFLALLEEGTGNLIELGKFKRSADLHAYLGLVASQGGDTAPGSDLPAAMCEIHHITAWKHGGRSTANNMGLVGHNVHDNTDDDHQDRNKWWSYCTSTGHLVWQPPQHIDKQRRPRMNISPATWFIPGQVLRLGGILPTCRCSATPCVA